MTTKKRSLIIIFTGLIVLIVSNLLYQILVPAKISPQPAWVTYGNQKLGLNFEHPSTWSEPVITPLSTKVLLEFRQDQELVFSISAGVDFNQDLQRKMTINEIESNLLDLDMKLNSYQTDHFIGFSYSTELSNEPHPIETTVTLASNNNLTQIYSLTYYHNDEEPMTDNLPKTLVSIISSLKQMQ